MKQPSATSIHKRIIKLYMLNALHRKREKRQQDWTLEEVLAHLKEEVGELQADPFDILELADVGILWLNAIFRTGRSLQEVAAAMDFKLDHHFGVEAGR